MKKINRHPQCFYWGQSPEQKDTSNYVKGDVWFDCIAVQAYILKLRRGRKKWYVHESFGK